MVLGLATDLPSHASLSSGCRNLSNTVCVPSLARAREGQEAPRMCMSASYRTMHIQTPTLNFRIAPAACEHKAAIALLLLLVS